MPAARSRDELIQVTTRDYAKLQKLLEAVDTAFVERADADGWSIRDVIAHRAHWAELFLHWRAYDSDFNTTGKLLNILFTAIDLAAANGTDTYSVSSLSFSMMEILLADRVVVAPSLLDSPRNDI